MSAPSLGSAAMTDLLSRRLPLGHRDRRAPGRGRQLEQRLVGVRAHARHRGASSRPATRATTSGATPTTSRCSPTSASARTASRSSGRASSPRTASSPTRALDHYRRMLATCHEHGLLPVVTFHHFTTPRWAAADGGWAEPGDRRPVRPVLRAGRSRTSATTSAMACTINEPNVVSLMGYLRRRVPARHHDLGAYATGERAPEGRAPHGVRRDQGRPGRLPGRAHASRWATGGRPRAPRPMLERDPAHARGPAPRGRARATTSSACRRTRAPASPLDGPARRPRAGRRGARHGLRVLAAGARGDRSGTRPRSPASPVYVTENGIGTTDDDAAHPVRDRRARGRRPLPRRRPRRARLLLLVAARQLRVGARLHAALRARRRRPRDPGSAR